MSGRSIGSQMTFESPAQLAERVGLPVTNIRHLIKANLLDHVYTTPKKRNPKIPSGAWERYLESQGVQVRQREDEHDKLVIK